MILGISIYLLPEFGLTGLNVGTMMDEALKILYYQAYILRNAPKIVAAD